MRVFSQKGELRDFLRESGQPLCLVPTMGALHAGHEALIGRAVSWAGKSGAGQGRGLSAVSIFVNPAQFGQAADFENYPQTLEADLQLCERLGVDLVFVPSAEEMYAEGASLQVSEGRLSQDWEGASRVGHFAGVCLVLTKLFALLRPEAAVFGEKDWQQVAVVKRLVRDLDLGVEVMVHPTVREAQGLALSSRNERLSAQARQQAGGIFAALEAMRALAQAGGSVASVLDLGRGKLALVAGLEVDYLAVVDEGNLEELALDLEAGQARVLFAGWLEGVRLLDTLGLG